MEMGITIQQVFLRDCIPPTTQELSGKVIRNACSSVSNIRPYLAKVTFSG